MSQQNNNLFDLDDIFEDKKSRADLTGVIGVIIRLMLAITTAGFFFEYVGNLFNWVTGANNLYGPWLSAVTGVFMIDALAYFWSKQRQTSGNTQNQITTATRGTMGNMGLSVLVTVVFIILQTNFVEIRHSDGGFNDLGTAVNIAGLIIATLAFAGNGILWAYFDSNSFAAIQALRDAALKAARAAGIFAIDERRNKMTIGRTIEQLNADLPRYTTDAAGRARIQYLKENFHDIDADGDGRLSDEELRQHGIGQRPDPRENDTYTLIRLTPRSRAWKEVDNFSFYLQAVGQMKRDGKLHAPGTKYRILLNGRIIEYHETDSNRDIEHQAMPAHDNGRPTRPRFE